LQYTVAKDRKFLQFLTWRNTRGNARTSSPNRE